VADFQQAHRDWVEDALRRQIVVREGRWSEAIAVGSLSFVEKVKGELGFKAAHREVIEAGGMYALREESEAYGSHFGGESEALRLENARFWNQNPDAAAT
jgi:hypothetical protein